MTLELHGVGAADDGLERGPGPLLAALDEVSRSVFECLDHSPMSMEEVGECAGLTAEVVSSILLALEIGGLVASDSGSRYFRATEA